MSNPYSTEPVEILDDWNAILGRGCCCTMPVCPTPIRECESLTVSATSSDDDYTDAHAAWVAGGSVGSPPAKPAGYDDVAHGSWLPFTEPGGAVTLYRELDTPESQQTATGTIYHWLAEAGIDIDNFAFCLWHVYTFPGGGWVINGNAWDYNYSAGLGSYGGFTVVPYTPLEDDPTEFPAIGGGFSWVEDDPPIGAPCTATTRELVYSSRHADAGGSAADGHAIGDSLNTAAPPPITADPTGWTTADDWQWTDLTEKESATQTLGSGVTLDDVKTRATAKIPAEWPDPATESNCVASYSETWPSPDGAGWPSPWPDCNSEDLPISAAGDVSLTKARFKWVIPDTWEGSYFKITWDVVNFPTTGDPVAVTTDNTWEWTGPGDPEDPDSWKSGWYEIPVPTEPGLSRIVNIRFECYAGPYGHLPQITGEAYEYPPPP